MIRKISSLALTALALLAMFWGNCLSCPEVLTGAFTHSPAHSCCHKPQSSSTSCHTQDMRQFVGADAPALHGPSSVAVLTELPAPALLARADFLQAPIATYIPPGGSPSPLPLRV